MLISKQLKLLYFFLTFFFCFSIQFNFLYAEDNINFDFSIYSFDETDGLISNSIEFVIQDKNGYLWVFTDSGFTKFDGIKFHFYSNSKVSMIPKEIRKIILNKNSQSQKIFKKYLNEDQTLMDISIKSILKDRNDNIWIGTIGDGVFMKTPDSRKMFKMNIPFLENDFINDIFEDREGNIWFSTESNGLVRLIKKESSLKTTFPIIEKVFLNNEDITNQLNPIINNPNRIIEFHFTGIYFRAAEKLRFRYKLEGYDKDWEIVKPGFNRLNIYINLKPGIYSFLLQSSISDKKWSKATAKYDFKIVADKSKYFIFFLILLFFISIIIFIRIKTIKYNNKRTIKESKDKYKTSGLNKEYAEKTLKQLLSYMDNGAPYLEPSLNLKKLSEVLNIQYNHLSQIINEKLNQNSNDFINKYRIEAAKKMLSEDRKKSVLDIAYECGFYSKSVFNTAFKKFTGLTPSQYRKK